MPEINHRAVSGKILNELLSAIANCKRNLVLNEQDWKVSNYTVLKPNAALIYDELNDKYITKTSKITVDGFVFLIHSFDKLDNDLFGLS